MALTFGSMFAVVDLLELQCDPMALVEKKLVIRVHSQSTLIAHHYVAGCRSQF